MRLLTGISKQTQRFFARIRSACRCSFAAEANGVPSVSAANVNFRMKSYASIGLFIIVSFGFATSAHAIWSGVQAPAADADGTFTIQFGRIPRSYNGYGGCEEIDVWAEGSNPNVWYYPDNFDYSCNTTSASFSNLPPDTYYFYIYAYYYDYSDDSEYEEYYQSSHATVVAPPRFAISDAPSVSEGNSLAFTVTRTVSDGIYSVDYTTVNGSALSSSDYTGKSGALTFSSGQASRTIPVTTTHDSIYEPNEYLYVRLSNPSGNASISDNSGTGYINNNDSAPSFRINNVSVAEGGPLAFTITKTGASAFNHSIDYATANGSAGSADYTSVDDSITFGPGEASKTVNVYTTHDTLFEDNETLYVDLSNPTAGATIADSRGAGTVANNDNAPSFAVNNVSVSEGGTLNFTITKTGSTSRTHQVYYTTANGSADSSDYTGTSGWLSFGPGETSKTVPVATKHDTVFEANETLYLNLSSPSAGATLADPQGQGIITNNDTAPSFAVNNVSVSEGGTLAFTISKSGSTHLSHSVSFSTSNGSANSSDYISKSGSVIFSASQTSQIVEVVTKEDTRFENQETLYLNLSDPTDGATLADVQGQGKINNDDSAPSFRVSDATGSEGNTLTFTISKTGSTALSHSVQFNTTNGTASSSDYTGTSGSHNFGPGDTSKTVTITTTEDTLFENAESLYLNLVSPTAGATVADAQGKAWIYNDDPAPTFTVNNTSVDEGGTLRFTISKHGASAFSHSVNFATSNGSADNHDYTGRSGTLSFASSSAASQSQYVDIKTTADSIFENSETLNLNLSVATGGAVIADSTGTGTIGNDDSAPNFIIYDAQAQPESGQLVFSVALSHASQFTHSVNFATANGSALAPQDYTAKSGSLSFNPLQTTAQTIAVNLAADNDYEGTERLYLDFTAPTAGAYLPDTQAYGDIIDNNCAPEFTIVDTAEVEGTPVKVWVQCQNGIRNVDFQITAGSASQGSDYTTPSGYYTGNLDFDGVNLKYIDINLQPDNVYEANESFHITLHDPADASIVIDSAIVTIQEDDAPPSFVISNVSANEGDNLVFTVTKTGATALSHSVNYTSFTNTAGNTDFNPVSGTLIFAANQTSQTIPVQSLEDATYEGNEIFTVNLHAPSNAATIADSQGIGTIIEDDNPPVFNVSNTSTTEGQDLSFTITRDGATPLYQTVEYAINNGTALAGVDYSRAWYTGTVIFQNGEIQHKITMSTTDDDVFETNETVILTLSNATDGAQLGTATATGTIENNDAAPSFSINNASGNEGNNLSFTISKTGSTAYSHSVDYTTVHGSADSGDYISKSGTATFSASQSSQTVTIHTVADSMYEQNEDFTITLSAASNGASISNATGNGLILNNDPQPTVSISDAQATEGDSLTFTVTMTGSTDHTTTVSYSTSDDTANTSDYNPMSGTLSFASGASSQTITVPTSNDYYIEDDERFYLALSGPTTGSISISDSTGIGTITNDDSIDDIQLPTAATDPIDDSLGGGTPYWGQLQGEHRVDQDGSFTYKIPIEVPPGINSMQPDLALSYNSNRRNGVVGWGWRVDGTMSSVTRCRADLVRDGEVSGINTGDNYKYCLDGQRLVQTGTDEYRTESESFQKIIRIGGERVPSGWEVRNKNGTVRYYGSGSNSTIHDGQNNAMRWYLRERRDIAGNYMAYHYEITATDMHRLDRIKYTKHDQAQGTNHRVDFDYLTRPDARINYTAGTPVVVDERLAFITVSTNSSRVRRYELIYQVPGQSYDDASYDDPAQTSRLHQIELCYDIDERCAEPVTLAWTSATDADYGYDENEQFEYYDESLPPEAYWYDNGERRPSRRLGYAKLDRTWMQEQLGQVVTLLADYRIDIDGDNLKEFVTYSNTTWEESQAIESFRSIKTGGITYREKLDTGYIDFNGDGLEDLYMTSTFKTAGFQVYINNNGHLSYEPDYSIVAGELVNAEGDYWHLTMKDINGDGLVDLIKTGKPLTPQLYLPIFLLSDTNIYVAINNGNGFDDFVSWGDYSDYTGIVNIRAMKLTGIGNSGSATTTSLLGDINSDTLPDIVIFSPEGGLEVGLNTGSSFEYSTSWDWGWEPRGRAKYCGAWYPHARPIMISEIMRLGDFNGDGVTDLAFVEEDGIYVTLNNGTRFEQPQRWSDVLTTEKMLCDTYEEASTPDSYNLFYGYDYWTILDLNRDGISDISYKEMYYEHERRAVYSSGSAQRGFTPYRALGESVYTDYSLPRISLTEKGDPILVWSFPNSTAIKVNPLAPKPTRLLKVMEGATGQARAIDIRYENINGNHELYTQTHVDDGLRPGTDLSGSQSYNLDDPIKGQHDPTRPGGGQNQHIVAQLRVLTHGDLQKQSDYHYFNLRQHTQGYGSLGFQKIQRTDTVPGFTEKRRIVSEYHQSADEEYQLTGLKRRHSCVIADDSIEECNGATLLSETNNHWMVRTLRDDIDGTLSPHYHVYILEASTSTWDLDGSYQSTKQFSAFDAGGSQCADITPDVSMVAAGSAGDTHYHPDGVLLHSDTVTCDGSAGPNAVVRKQEIHSDISSTGSVWGLIGRTELIASTGSAVGALGAPQTRTLAYSYYTSGQHQGRLHTTTVEPDAPVANQETVVTTLSYNDYGSVYQTTQSWQNIDDNGLSFNSRKTTVDESYTAEGERVIIVENPLNQTETTQFNAAFGLPRRVSDLNGLVTITDYDALGRPVEIDHPGNTVTRFTYMACDSDCGGFLSATSNDTQASWYIQTKTTGQRATREYFDDFDRPVGTRHYDLLGNMIYSYQIYDLRGNIVEQVDPFFLGEEKHTTLLDYDILNRLTRTDFADSSYSEIIYNGTSSTHTNRIGQSKTIVKNALGLDRQATDFDGTSVVFSYWPFGELKTTQVNGDSDTDVTIDYDTLGRRTQLFDPNTGIMHFTYNPLGLLASETDAKGQVTRYAYDKLDRQTHRTDDAIGTARTHRWTYDAAAYGIGLPAGMSGYNTDGSHFSESYSYTDLSRPDTVLTQFNGRGFRTRTLYDDFNRPLATIYPSGFAVRSHYNDHGHLHQVENVANGDILWQAEAMDARGNLTQYTYGNGIVTHRDYVPETGLIDTIVATNGSTVIQDHDYDFDPLGNLQTRADRKRGITESFCYDTMNRLVGAGIGACTHSENSYDAYGNILSKRGVAGSYEYGHGSAGPNAVTRANNLSYEYDANGNFKLAKDSQNQIVKSAVYSAFNKPTQLTDNGNSVDIIYGPHKNRIQRSDSTGRTSIYAGLGSYEETTYNGTTQQVHYVGNVGEFVIESGNNNGSYYLFTHTDHIGSTVAKTRMDLAQSEFLANDAWGERLDGAWDAQKLGPDYQPTGSARGFTNHEHLDAVGLIHMNGRVYDPQIGRFLSPDLYIQAPTNTQSYNRYTYVFNNPLSFVDPTGYRTINTFNSNISDECLDMGGSGQYGGDPVGGCADVAAQAIGDADQQSKELSEQRAETTEQQKEGQTGTSANNNNTGANKDIEVINANTDITEESKRDPVTPKGEKSVDSLAANGQNDQGRQLGKSGPGGGPLLVTDRATSDAGPVSAHQLGEAEDQARSARLQANQPMSGIKTGGQRLSAGDVTKGHKEAITIITVTTLVPLAAEQYVVNPLVREAVNDVIISVVVNSPVQQGLPPKMPAPGKFGKIPSAIIRSID